MAFRTVPLVTSEVNTTSYMEPLVENVHYIFIKNSNELQEKISKISKDEYENMSRACYEWYQRNVHSINCWKNVIHYILYK